MAVGVEGRKWKLELVCRYFAVQPRQDDPDAGEVGLVESEDGEMNLADEDNNFGVQPVQDGPEADGGEVWLVECGVGRLDKMVKIVDISTDEEMNMHMADDSGMKAVQMSSGEDKMWTRCEDTVEMCGEVDHDLAKESKVMFEDVERLEGTDKKEEVKDEEHDPSGLETRILDIFDSCSPQDLSQDTVPSSRNVEEKKQAEALTKKDWPNAPNKMFEVGSFCIALWTEDNTWYNGLVKMVNKDGSFLVEFVDYGNVETVAADKIVVEEEEIPALCKVDQWVGQGDGDRLVEMEERDMLVKEDIELNEESRCPELEEIVVYEKEQKIEEDSITDSIISKIIPVILAKDRVFGQQADTMNFECAEDQIVVNVETVKTEEFVENKDDMDVDFMVEKISRFCESVKIIDIEKSIDDEVLGQAPSSTTEQILGQTPASSPEQVPGHAKAFTPEQVLSQTSISTSTKSTLAITKSFPNTTNTTVQAVPAKQSDPDQDTPPSKTMKDKSPVRPGLQEGHKPVMDTQSISFMVDKNRKLQIEAVRKEFGEYGEPFIEGEYKKFKMKFENGCPAMFWLCVDTDAMNKLQRIIQVIQAIKLLYILLILAVQGKVRGRSGDGGGADLGVGSMVLARYSVDKAVYRAKVEKVVERDERLLRLVVN